MIGGVKKVRAVSNPMKGPGGGGGGALAEIGEEEDEEHDSDHDDEGGSATGKVEASAEDGGEDEAIEEEADDEEDEDGVAAIPVWGLGRSLYARQIEKVRALIVGNHDVQVRAPRICSRLSCRKEKSAEDRIGLS
jgi:hypothetical protein